MIPAGARVQVRLHNGHTGEDLARTDQGTISEPRDNGRAYLVEFDDGTTCVVEADRITEDRCPTCGVPLSQPPTTDDCPIPEDHAKDPAMNIDHEFNPADVAPAAATDDDVAAEEVLRILDEYDRLVRANRSDDHDTLAAVATCRDGLYGAWGEVLDTARDLGLADERIEALHGRLLSAFVAYQNRLAAEVEAERVARDHDHYETVESREDHGLSVWSEEVIERDGVQMVPFRCHDCGRAAYYDLGDDKYHHAEDPGVGCFLIPAEPERAEDRTHPDLVRRAARRTTIAASIIIEVMAQLEELSDETCSAFDDDEHEEDRAFAEDLRETLIATVDQRFADFMCDAGLDVSPSPAAADHVAAAIDAAG